MAAEIRTRAKAEEEAIARAAVAAKAAAEARAAEEARQRQVAELKANEESKHRQAAEIKAAEEALLRLAAEAKAAEETRLRAVAEAKAAEQARIAAEIKARACAEPSVTPADTTGPTNPSAASNSSPQIQSSSSTKPKSSKTSSKAIWHYTSEGDRLGPVTFEELRAMALDSSLDPRLDMVWRQGSEAWKPAGQIDGLFERTQIPVEAPNEQTAPSKAVKTSKKQAKPASAPATAGNTSWPGSRRRSMLAMVLVFPVAWHYLLVAAGPLLIKQFGADPINKVLPYAALLPLLLLIHFGLKRLVNLGMSRWWGLAVFAPFLNLWLGYRCLACPAGFAHHKKMDGPGIALAILYWLLTISLILMLSAFLALVFGVIQSPALQNQLRSLF